MSLLIVSVEQSWGNVYFALLSSTALCSLICITALTQSAWRHN